MRRFGTEGLRLARLAHGNDTRGTVSAERETKSVSAETTFATDIAVFRDLERTLWRLTEKVSARLKAKALAGATVTLKLKTADFRLRTRARNPARGADPARRAKHLRGRARASGARDRRHQVPPARHRRLVARLADPADADPADLVDRHGERSKAAEHAVDRLRAKFGRAAVVTGRGLGADDDDD